MNPYLNSLNGFGGGLIAFWPVQGAAQGVEVVLKADVAGGGGWPSRDDYRKKKRKQQINADDEELMRIIKQALPYLLSKL